MTMEMVRLCLNRDFMALEWEESSAVAEVTATAVIVAASTVEETVSEAVEWVTEMDSTTVAASVVELAVVVATEAMAVVIGIVAASEVRRLSMLPKKVPRCSRPRLNHPPNKNMTKRLKKLQ